MKKAVIAVALSVLAALLSANVNTVAHAQGNLVAPSNVTAQHTGTPGEVRISWGAVPQRGLLPHRLGGVFRCRADNYQRRRLAGAFRLHRH